MPEMSLPDSDPPTYRIDLSRPPFERYLQLATDFKAAVSSVIPLFDEVVKLLHPWLPISPVRFLARLMLRKVYSAEETEEMRGISHASGVEMFLIVALNTFLDLMMGCTSGGVRTKEGQGARAKMLHFRTLDWEMEPLRKLVVQVEFVREGRVVGKSITYAGYVGVLTGVRFARIVAQTFPRCANRAKEQERSVPVSEFETESRCYVSPCSIPLLHVPAPGPAWLPALHIFNSARIPPCADRPKS